MNLGSRFILQVGLAAAACALCSCGSGSSGGGQGADGGGSTAAASGGGESTDAGAGGHDATTAGAGAEDASGSAEDASGTADSASDAATAVSEGGDAAVASDAAGSDSGETCTPPNGPTFTCGASASCNGATMYCHSGPSVDCTPIPPECACQETHGCSCLLAYVTCDAGKVSCTAYEDGGELWIFSGCQ